MSLGICECHSPAVKPEMRQGALLDPLWQADGPPHVMVAAILSIAVSTALACAILATHTSRFSLVSEAALYDDSALAVCCWVLFAGVQLFAMMRAGISDAICVGVTICATIMCLYLERRHRLRKVTQWCYCAPIAGVVVTFVSSSSWRAVFGILARTAWCEWSEIAVSAPPSAPLIVALFVEAFVLTVNMVLIAMLHLIRGWVLASDRSLALFSSGSTGRGRRGGSGGGGGGGGGGTGVGVVVGGGGGGGGGKRQRKERKRMLSEFTRRTGELAGQLSHGQCSEDGSQLEHDALRATGARLPMSTTTQLFCIHTLCHLAQANCYFVLAITLPRHALCLSYMFRTIGVWYVVAIAIRAALYLCLLPSCGASGATAAFVMHLFWKATRFVHGILLVPPIFDRLLGSPRGDGMYQPDVWLEFLRAVNCSPWHVAGYFLLVTITGFISGVVNDSLAPLTRHQAFKRWTERIDEYSLLSLLEPLELNLGHLIAIGVSYALYDSHRKVTDAPYAALRAPPIPKYTIVLLLVAGMVAMRIGCKMGTRLRAWGEVAQAMLIVSIENRRQGGGGDREDGGGRGFGGATTTTAGSIESATVASASGAAIGAGDVAGGGGGGTDVAAIAASAHNGSPVDEYDDNDDDGRVLPSMEIAMVATAVAASTLYGSAIDPLPSLPSSLRGARAATTRRAPPIAVNQDSYQESPPPSRADESTLCIVCEERPHTHAFVPCGHYCVCDHCGNDLLSRGQPCPLCRKYALMVMRVY